MQSILRELTDLLSSSDRFVADGKLLKNKIIERTLAMDPELLKLLLTNKTIKVHFFQDIEGILVFDKIKFQKFISNKEFLPDSFTAFKNKIGLVNDRGDYISSSKEIILAWPYKDCVLEGGQTKEDENRDEIFWNETLAPDEIDRLLSPKVMCNFMLYDKNGEHNLSIENDIDFSKENMIIKGNNLLVLHSLYERFAEKIKLIYIDPPYNRDEDKDSFYNDSFNHSTWLTFMKNRLEIARLLLSKSGLICISVDDNEASYLKVLCDQEFGENNFLSTISYERSGVSGLGQGGDFLVNTHESIICYAKERNQLVVHDLTGEGTFGFEEMKRYNKILKHIGEGEEFTKFTAPSTGEDVIIYKHDDYEIETISLRSYEKRETEIRAQYVNNFEKVFRNTSIQEENEFQNRILSICSEGLYSAKYLVSRGKYKGQWITTYYLNGGVFVWLRESAKVTDGLIVKTNKLSDFWGHASIPKADLANEGGVKLRRGKKPENLLRRLIAIGTGDRDLVMDFHLGSGTTAAVAHKMGRQYIGIEQIDYGENDSIVRLKNVINGEQTGISKTVNWQGGGSFIFCELMKWNESFIEKIQTADNNEILLAIWGDIQEKAFLSYKIKPDVINESISDFKDLTLEEQKKFLIQILDKNQLYVNYSEIGDEEYGVSETNKKLNKIFYRGIK